MTARVLAVEGSRQRNRMAEERKLAAIQACTCKVGQETNGQELGMFAATITIRTVTVKKHAENLAAKNCTDNGLGLSESIVSAGRPKRRRDLRISRGTIPSPASAQLHPLPASRRALGCTLAGMGLRARTFQAL